MFKTMSLAIVCFIFVFLANIGNISAQYSCQTVSSCGGCRGTCQQSYYQRTCCTPIVGIPPGAPCGIPNTQQVCTGGSSCQFTYSLGVCTCPNGQSACGGVCRPGGCGAAVATQTSSCNIPAGSYCGLTRQCCTANAVCHPITQMCSCNQGYNRRQNVCLPY